MTTKWTVRWRYPDGGGWQRTQVESEIRPTASTQIEAFPAPCPQYYLLEYRITYQVATSGGITVPSQCMRRVRNIDNNVLGPFLGPFERHDGQRWRVQVDRYSIEGVFLETVNLFSGCYSPSHQPPGVHNLVITPTGTYEGECVEGKCTFKILVGDAVVFSEQNDVCPEVEVQEGQCPPGTIECGDCCLDCDEYVGSVRSLTNKLRQLNKSPVTKA